MSELDPTLSAALALPHVTLFGAVELTLPGRTVRLLDGAAEVPIEGHTYTGRDPDWGVIDTIKGLQDSNGDTAPAPSLGLIPADDLALSAMLDPGLQGSPVRILLGALNPATGLPIGTCYQMFIGELDVPTVKWGQNDRRVEFRLLGIGDRVLTPEEGRRLSDSFHQLVWPGELGLAFVTEVENTVDWGQASKGGGEAIRSNLPGYGAGFPTAQTLTGNSYGSVAGAFFRG